MEATQEWKVTIVTPGKIYEGKISCDPNLQDKRTLSLLNANKSGSIMDKHFLKGHISLTDVSLLLNSKKVFTADKLLIKTSHIIFAYDEYKQMGSDIERKKFYSLQEQRSQRPISVNIATLTTKDSFYTIRGEYKEAFKNIVSKQFVPLVNVAIEEIFEKEDQVCKEKQDTKPFIALNRNYIESIHVID
jgi:hypothetical protein